ncbi:MAG: 50S ribosomal protein L24 [Nitrospirales bacterium]|nr:50S ribosomal protein L24 [Nitrospirales bacterium]
MGLKVKKGDNALIISGKDKGKSGRVLAVHPLKDQVVVEGHNVVKKHMKPSKAHAQGGIIEKEAPMHSSNVMVMCPKCNKPTRIGNTVLEGGKKLRTCTKCKEVID